MTPDIINACFEGLGAFFVAINIRKILIDKIVRGYDWKVMAFFTFWGVWNLYYYPYLGQWFSFAAGVAIAVTNTIYLLLILYYIRKEHRNV